MHSLQQIKQLNDLAVVNKTYTINNKQYQVECDFINNTIACRKDNSSVFKTTLDDYLQFSGSWAQYICRKVSPVSNRAEV